MNKPSKTNDSELREALIPILQKHWAGAYKAGQNGKMLAQLITEPIIEDAVLNKIVEVFASQNKKAIQHTLDKVLSEMGGKKRKLLTSSPNAEGYNTAHQEIVELINKIRKDLE